jgi:hypothetical protein
MRPKLHEEMLGSFSVASLVHDKSADIDVTFSKCENHIVVQQCGMPVRQTVCRAAKTQPKTH